MQTCFDLVWLAAERTPDHLAIVDDQSDRQLTYSQLIDEIEAVAVGLQQRGVKPGDRIATVLPSLFDHVIVLLALQRLIAVPALINFRLKQEEIAQLIELGELTGAVIPADENMAAVLKEALPEGAPLLSVGGAAGPAEDYAQCRGDGSSLSAAPIPDPEDEAFIFYTSGTTGLPKGVVLAQKTVEHRILWISTQAGYRYGTHNVSLGFMPLSHAIGYFGVLLLTLAHNGTYHVMSAFNPVAANDAVENLGVNYLFAVPQLLFAMTKAPNYDPAKMKSLELVLHGGAQISGDLLDQIGAEWPCQIRHIYGTTETMNSLYHPNPVGHPLRLRPGFYSRVRIIEVGGTPDQIVGVGQEGELIIDANVDTIFSSYLNRPDATAEALRDGWYYSGDVCLKHENGDMDLIGRVDDMIRSGGENIHPSEVEPTLESHPAIKEVSLIGIPDPKWGEMVVACLTAVDSDWVVEAAELDTFMKESTVADFKRPKAYVFMNALPRNAANKILRRELREIAVNTQAGDGDWDFVTV